MFAFIVRRIIQAIIVMLVISLVGFSIQHQIGDPVRDLVGERVTPAEREVIRDQLGLNDPFYVQYARFVKNASKGDLGLSFFYKKPALKVIAAKAPRNHRAGHRDRPYPDRHLHSGRHLFRHLSQKLVLAHRHGGQHHRGGHSGLSDGHRPDLSIRGGIELVAIIWTGRNR